jgi:hypothetical protein
MLIRKYKYDNLLREYERCKERNKKILVSPEELESKYGENAIRRFIEICWPGQKGATFCMDDKYDFTYDEYVYICTGKSAI